MKERQSAHHALITKFRLIQQLAQLFHIGGNIAMRENRALGYTSCSTGILQHSYFWI